MRLVWFLYCICILVQKKRLAGHSSEHVIANIISIQNSAAKLSFLVQFDHVIPLFESLSWFPVLYRVKHKLLLFTFKVLYIQSPPYLSALICYQSVDDCLQSAYDDSLRYPLAKFQTSTFVLSFILLHMLMWCLCKHLQSHLIIHLQILPPNSPCDSYRKNLDSSRAVGVQGRLPVMLTSIISLYSCTPQSVFYLILRLQVPGTRTILLFCFSTAPSGVVVHDKVSWVLR